MTLQELIGELNTLSLAYPPETRVAVQDLRYSQNISEISTIKIESTSEVLIVLEGI